jgi:hypothetical protein
MCERLPAYGSNVLNPRKRLPAEMLVWIGWEETLICPQRKERANADSLWLCGEGAVIAGAVL